jgi:phosphatidylinositol glycan class B
MQLKATQAYVCFAIFRILNALLIQSQFDPDEYWQNLEPAYCQVFGEHGKPCSGLTWEWKRRPSSTNVESLNDLLGVGLEGPVRSYVSILPTMLLYYLLKVLAIDSTFLVAKGPILLNAVLVAAPTDWTVWWMSRWMESPTDREKGSLPGWCTFCSITSWFWAYALVRPYSNSLEAVMLAMSLALVAKVRRLRI